MNTERNEDFILFMQGVTRSIHEMRSFVRNKIKEKGLDLTFEMVQILKSLWDKQHVNQQELANITMKDKASLTYLIDNLSKRGLVIRTEDKNDRRNKLISLTEEGIALRKTMQPCFDELYAVAGKDVDPKLVTAGLDLFKKINENIYEAGLSK
jgi:DNA-binding MarR family transcriptional regulator